ncbi:MAG: UbiA prenyltransferase family protein [Lachnospiraceae bacterium]|nr:UbiA prenyltransferase family protein [Lachnospiraceae bacterium]
MLKDYIKIARPDHWIKQLFIVPGSVFAWFLVGMGNNEGVLVRFILAFISTCFVASANYVINEWLDADFDKYHPTKKNRPVVSDNLSVKWILTEYAVLGIAGLVFGYLSCKPVFFMELWLFIMGILYNVRPMRTKEIPYLDVLSESVNNAIRLLIGWFAVTLTFYPPISIVLGYWMSGAFLMAVKRYSEYRMIGDKTTAGLYRKSFKYYSEQSLLISAFFYALMAVFFCGIFLIKYKIELIIAIPLLCGLFCYYLHISYKKDSSVQKPEKLYKEKGLLLYLFVLIVVFIILMFVDINGLQMFLGKDLIPVK